MINESKGLRANESGICRSLWCMIFILLCISTGCGDVTLTSRWLDRQISIDGKIDDWKEALVYLERKKISFGLFNDGEFLYMCMISDQPDKQMQVMRQGLILWFDPDGGKRKVRGIKFPVGMELDDMKGDPMMRPPEPDEWRDSFRNKLTRIEFLENGEDIGVRMPVADLKGLEIELAISQGLMVYELKIPLKFENDYSFVIGANEPGKLGVGLRIPKTEMPDFKGGRPGSGSGMKIAGQQGGPGGMPGSGMRPPAGMGFEKPKPLKVWVTVELASQ